MFQQVWLWGLQFKILVIASKRTLESGIEDGDVVINGDGGVAINGGRIWSNN